MRVLVAISPRMYRETVALCIFRNRSDLDVRMAPPEYAAGELASFRPHLLIHTNALAMPVEALVGFPLMLAVPRSDLMDSGTDVEDQVEWIGEAYLEDLLRAVGSAAVLVSSV